jgi:hypothetical protein
MLQHGQKYHSNQRTSPLPYCTISTTSSAYVMRDEKFQQFSSSEVEVMRDGFGIQFRPA